jgi:hypothetical protein
VSETAEADARPRAVLLDTCAVIWLANGSAMAEVAVAAIVQAGLAEGVFVSPVSAWEVGLLARLSQARPVRFLPDPKAWFARVMAGPGIRPAPSRPRSPSTPPPYRVSCTATPPTGSSSPPPGISGCPW